MDCSFVTVLLEYCSNLFVFGLRVCVCVSVVCLSPCSGYKMIISEDLEDAAVKAVAVAEIYSQAVRVRAAAGHFMEYWFRVYYLVYSI